MGRATSGLGRSLRAVLVLALVAGGLVLASAPARASVFIVDTTADTTECVAIGACSLRGAILRANTIPTSQDTIVLAPGQTYELTRSPAEGDEGGDLDIRSHLVIQGNGSTISQTQSDRVIEVHQGQVRLEDLTILGGNHSDGGGILNLGGTLTVSSSTISGNQAANGGGILNFGTLTVSSSTISGNEAGIFAGGIVNVGTLTVSSSTISGNQAGFRGGGIWNEGTLTVSSSTISGNQAVDGGGIGNFGPAAASLRSSIVAQNTADSGADCFGSFTSQGFNVIGSAGQCGAVADDVVADPLLGPLQDNGGPTETHAIDAASPAKDLLPTTEPDCTGDDQRGVPRPQGAGCDAGAFELESDPAPEEVAVSGQTLVDGLRASRPLAGVQVCLDGVCTTSQRGTGHYSLTGPPGTLQAHNRVGSPCSIASPSGPTSFVVGSDEVDLDIFCPRG